MLKWPFFSETSIRIIRFKILLRPCLMWSSPVWTSLKHKITGLQHLANPATFWSVRTSTTVVGLSDSWLLLQLGEEDEEGEGGRGPNVKRGGRSSCIIYQVRRQWSPWIPHLIWDQGYSAFRWDRDLGAEIYRNIVKLFQANSHLYLFILFFNSSLKASFCGIVLYLLSCWWCPCWWSWPW